MRPSALLYLYRRRLRAHRAQELFAGIGIAIAVALVFAATVAEKSISNSAAQVVHAVVGPASLQLRARDGDGFSETLFTRVKELPGVKQAAPLQEQTATIISSTGRHTTVYLAGADLRLAVLDGLAETLPIGALTPGGVGLSQSTAQALAITSARAGGKQQQVTLKLRGRAYRLRVSAVLGPETAGALSHALVAVMPLSRMQQLAGVQGMITRVLVQTEPGQEAAVRAELERLAGGRLEVAPADQDVTLLSEALGPSDLASGLFAAIGGLLGFLLAFNAMLLTVADRRKTIADLRVSGARRATIVEMVLFEALCLGLVASLVGVLAGYALSVGAFHQSTKYLAEAFTLSSSTVVGTRALALSLAGGVLAACLASAIPLLDLRRGRARDSIYQEGGVPGDALNRPSQRRLFAAALCLLAAATLLLALAPQAAIVATALLALATVLAVPLVFAGVLAGAGVVAERWQRISILPIALASLKATTVRSLALAATGAVALFGSVALGGSRQNLLQGIESFARSYVADANVWVTNPGDNQAVEDFRAGDYPARISRLSAVARVQAFQGGFLQLGSRRVWIIARPPGAERQVLQSQIRGGSVSAAIARLGQGGWIALSQQIATEHHVGVGDTLVLPTPTGPQRLRIAATTTNLAWPPGVIFMSSADYSHAWASSAPTALGVELRPNANPQAARTAIERALGPTSGLEVSLAQTRAARIEALANEGLGQLQEISTLLLIAAMLAMVAALGSSVWQRRSALAGLRLFGATPYSLQGILLLEALLMLGAGCLTGALAGVYGQVVVDGYLRHVTGFPLASPTTSARPVEIFALVLLVALALGAIPGWLASRVRPVLALGNE
jgi:putative ABC transport system permease protein